MPGNLLLAQAAGAFVSGPCPNAKVPHVSRG